MLMRRRSLSRGFARGALFAALALSLAACTRERREGPPDVVLVVLDTLRARSLSLYGYERNTSPALEDFAKEAVTYAQAITPGTWTVPAHGSLFTGLTPSYHGAERVPGKKILATPVNPEAKMLAEIFRDNGWRTGAFVGNTTYVTGLLGFDRGFDTFADGLPDKSAPGVVSAALAWLDESPQQAFLFLNLLDPHEPYEPPPPFDERYPGRRAELGTLMTERLLAGEAVTPEMREHFVSQYDGEIAYTDAALALFFEGLRARGRYQDALIVVTADHGEFLGEHGLAGHGNATYEPLLHVPLLVKYPGNRDAGRRIDRRVSTLGVFATILEERALPRPPGVTAVPLDETHEVWLEEIDFAGNRIVVGYDGPWKLVRSAGQSGEATYLYDLDLDPGELAPRKDGSGAEDLRRRLDTFVAVPRPVNAAPAPVIDPERERQLRALGYVE